MSLPLLARIAALTSIVWMSIGHALAENRIALVIGNSNYASASTLFNPANDARAMARFLSAAGFQVLHASDLKQRDMLRTISNFAGLAAEKGPDTVALVYYAGHGLQIDGENYLVPVDAAIQREADVPLQSMRLVDLMNALSSVSVKARIVILDACRNNPFAEIKQTTGRGLAMVDAPSGSLISYSTAPGTEAQDGDGANSPYTAALLKVGREQGLPIEQALKRVRLAVNEATGKQQVPWESSSLTSEFSFFPRERRNTGRPNVASAPATNGLPAATQARSVDSWQKELRTQTPREAYETVIREDQVEAYEAYLFVYPSDPLAAAVRRIVERRREMIAWQDAVSLNTAASYQTFLAGHASSDFAPTAKRLVERPRAKRSVVSAIGNPASAAATTAAIVTAPVVVPVYDPRPVRVRPDWRPHRPHDHSPIKAGRPFHKGKLAGAGQQGKLGKSFKPSKMAARSRFTGRFESRRVTARPRLTMGRGFTMNRGGMGRGLMMGRGMSMGMRPSFGRTGFMGGMGGRRFF